MSQCLSQRRFGLVCCLLALGAIAGCGESTGSVKGKVYLKEKLVNGGDIAFVAANKKVSTTQIKADGSYELPAVPTGLAKISVSTPTEVKVPGGMTMKPGAMGAPEKSAEADTPKGKTVAIPEKYRDAEKSGLEFTVKTGQQEYDIKLP